jgi:endonuclease/exonuclease/phosphatase family metal-dependent hydrolase
VKTLALLLAFGACGDDGAAVDAMIDAERARTDLVPAVGTATTIDVACWNLKMFPTGQDTPRIASDLIASMQLDIVTVEEIESKTALEALVARLPGWQYAMPDPEGSANGGIAVLWNEDVVHSVSTTLFTDGRLIRPVVRAVFEVNGGQFALHAVHLKAGLAPVDEQARVDAAGIIEGNLRNLVDTSNIDRVLVLGDFNEDFDDDRAAEMFAVFTPDRYAVISKAVDDAGGVTFLPASVMLDQMVATTDFATAITEMPLIPPLSTLIPNYAATVSDHVPLVVRLAL